MLVSSSPWLLKEWKLWLLARGASSTFWMTLDLYSRCLACRVIFKYSRYVALLKALSFHDDILVGGHFVGLEPAVEDEELE